MNNKTKVVARTVLQTLVGVALVVPVLVEQTGVPETAGWVAGILAIAATVTRFMASPLGQKLSGFLNTEDKTEIDNK